MDAGTGTTFSVRSPNEALFTVAIGAARKDRRALPQVHYGFDHETYQREARGLWEALPRRGVLPPAGALKSMVIPLFRIHSVLFELPRGPGEPTIPYLGLEVARMSRLASRPERISDVPQDSVLARLPAFFARVEATLEPVEFSELAAVGAEGGTTFNGILLPFQDVDGHVSHIYAIIDENAPAFADDADVLMLTDIVESDAMSARLRQDLDILDLQLDQVLSDITVRSEEESLRKAASRPALFEALSIARDFAREAGEFDGRSRKALYAALGHAALFARCAENNPGQYADLLDASGITAQDRAPMTPIVKLVFGKDFDRTRLTEYAHVLAYGRENHIEPDALAPFLEAFDGGIKGIVDKRRRLRREERGERITRTEIEKAAARSFRAMPAKPLADLPAVGKEFALVFVRRMADGSIVMLGEIADDVATVEKLGKRLRDGSRAETTG